MAAIAELRRLLHIELKKTSYGYLQGILYLKTTIN